MAGKYQIDGLDIPDPTTGKWESGQEIGRDGLGKPVYPGVREYRLVWEYISPEDANFLFELYKSGESTGTHTVRLPAYDQLYEFKTYTGCHLTRPEFGEFFETHVSSFSLLIVNIRG